MYLLASSRGVPGLPHHAIQREHHIGPQRPMPFPGSGKPVELGVCPKCGNKGMPIWYAPYERGYRTKCLKCGVSALVHPKDVPLGEIRRSGGFAPRLPGVREIEKGYLDGTRLYNEAVELFSIGYSRAERLGIIPRQADQQPK